MTDPTTEASPTTPSAVPPTATPRPPTPAPSATAPSTSGPPTTSPELGSRGAGETAPLSELDLRLELHATTVDPGGSVSADLVVENRTERSVVDPGCVLDAIAFGVLAEDDPSGQLGGAAETDCGGAFEMAPGYAARHELIEFTAVDAAGRPLEPGRYLAVIRHGGGISQLAAPLIVTTS